MECALDPLSHIAVALRRKAKQPQSWAREMWVQVVRKMIGAPSQLRAPPRRGTNGRRRRVKTNTPLSYRPLRNWFLLTAAAIERAITSRRLEGFRRAPNPLSTNPFLSLFFKISTINNRFVSPGFFPELRKSNNHIGPANRLSSCVLFFWKTGQPDNWFRFFQGL